MTRAWTFLLTAAVSWACLLQTAVAQEAFVLCAAVKDNGDRLKCYDGLTAAVSAAAKKTEAPISVPMVWEIRDEKSPLDDSPSIFAGIAGVDGQGLLVLRCKERRSEVIIAPPNFVQCGGDSVRVTYRIDQGQPIEASWNSSSQCNAAFATSPIPFMRALPNGGRLFVRVSDRKGVPHDSSYDLGAVGEVRARIAEACQWDKPVAKPARPTASAVKP